MQKLLLTLYLYYTCLWHKITLNVFRLKYERKLRELKKNDLYEIRAFIKEVGKICQTSLLDEYEPPKINIELSIEFDNHREHLHTIRRKNPFQKYKIDDPHRLIDSGKIRSVQSVIVKYVFLNVFLIDLADEEAIILSWYPKVSTVCVFFLQFLNLDNKSEFRHDDYEKMQHFYKRFIAIVDVRNALNAYQSEISRTSIASIAVIIYCFKLIFIEKRASLFEFTHLFSNRFPTIKSHEFELHQLKLKRKNSSRELQINLLDLTWKSYFVSFELHTKMAADLAILSDKLIQQSFCTGVRDSNANEKCMLYFSNILCVSSSSAIWLRNSKENFQTDSDHLIHLYKKYLANMLRHYALCIR